MTKENRAAKAARHRHFVGDSATTRLFPCGKPRNKGTCNTDAFPLTTCEGCIEAVQVRRRKSAIDQERQRANMLRLQKLGTAAAAKARAERKAAKAALVEAYPTEAEREAARKKAPVFCTRQDCLAILTAEERLGTGECFECLRASEDASTEGFIAARLADQDRRGSYSSRPQRVGEVSMVVNLAVAGAAVRVEGTVEQIAVVLAMLGSRP